MFYVYDVGGKSSPYELGSLARLRAARGSRTQPVNAIDSLLPKDSETLVDERGESQQQTQQFVTSPYKKVLQERRTQVLYVADIMTSAIRSVDSAATIKSAWQLIRRHRFRHIPVLDQQKLVGIVSDRDILPLVSDFESAVSEPALAIISTVMSSPVLTVRPRTKIRVAAKVLLDEHVGALPVVDEDNNLQGMLTRTDILRAVVHHAPLEIWI
jgi:CBS domain-containing protein